MVAASDGVALLSGKVQRVAVGSVYQLRCAHRAHQSVMVSAVSALQVKYGRRRLSPGDQSDEEQFNDTPKAKKRPPRGSKPPAWARRPKTEPPD